MLHKLPIRKVIVYTLYILLFASFQVSFSDSMSFRGQIADLTFVFVVLTGYFFGFIDGAIVGLITGVVRDTLAAPTVISLDGTVQVSFGIGVLVLFLAGVAGSAFFTKRMHRNIPFAFLAVAAITLCYKVIGHLLNFFWIKMLVGEVYNLTASQALVDSIIPQIMLNCLVSVPIILLLRFLGPGRFRDRSDQKDDVIKEYGDNSWLRI